MPSASAEVRNTLGQDPHRSPRVHPHLRRERVADRDRRHQPGAAITSYVTKYDQDNRVTSVTENNASGTAVHTTTYGYDADSNQNAMTHDGVPSTYAYNNLEQLSQETDAQSATDTSPQVSTFTYTPAGQVLNAVKPNDNTTVANTYYANNLPFTVTEKTSGGTLVSSHTYTYAYIIPNANGVIRTAYPTLGEP